MGVLDVSFFSGIPYTSVLTSTPADITKVPLFRPEVAAPRPVKEGRPCEQPTAYAIPLAKISRKISGSAAVAAEYRKAALLFILSSAPFSTSPSFLNGQTLVPSSLPCPLRATATSAIT